MNAYIYKAAFYCENCGEAIRKELGACPGDIDDEYTYDSDDYPKGPYPEGGGESDRPELCDRCGAFLENPLTADGEQYILDMIPVLKAEALAKYRERYAYVYAEAEKETE